MKESGKCINTNDNFKKEKTDIYVGYQNSLLVLAHYDPTCI